MTPRGNKLRFAAELLESSRSRSIRRNRANRKVRTDSRSGTVRAQKEWLIVNIGCEEILWRGYALPLREKVFGKYAWIGVIIHGTGNLLMYVLLIPGVFGK